MEMVDQVDHLKILLLQRMNSLIVEDVLETPPLFLDQPLSPTEKGQNIHIPPSFPAGTYLKYNEFPPAISWRKAPCTRTVPPFVLDRYL